MVDVFGLVWRMLAPNDEWEAWKRVQRAWLAFAAERGIELVDEREDTWPVMKRQLGVLDGVALSLDGYTLVGEDLSPLISLTCQIASHSHLPSFSLHGSMATGDLDFDTELEVRTNDEPAARVLLQEDLRVALRAFGPPIVLHYASGHVMFSSGSSTLTSDHLEAVVAVVVAACHRSTSPYR